MTPQEADILRYMERRGGVVADSRLQSQFPYISNQLKVYLDSLLQHQQIEQDQRNKRYYRVTTVGEDALRLFDNHQVYVPFAGQDRW